MTTPLRPGMARDLIERAAAARLYRNKYAHGDLSAAEIVAGRHCDHANAGLLRRLAREHDWPGHRLVGETGAQAAWQIALYADHEPTFQRLMLQLLATAVEQGDAMLPQWAHLYDRWCINAGVALQLYGTQYRCGPDGGVVLVPVREPQRLDAHRAQAGLPPFASVAEAVRRRYTREQRTGPCEDVDPPDMVLLGRQAA